MGIQNETFSSIFSGFFQSISRKQGKLEREDIISGATKLSEYLNRVPTVVVELNSYTFNSSEWFSQLFPGGGKKTGFVKK